MAKEMCGSGRELSGGNITPQLIVSIIAALIGVLVFIDNRFIAGKNQERRITKVEIAVEDCQEVESRIDGLMEMKIKFEIWWKIFEQKALAGLHHPNREYLDWFIEHYSELTDDELRVFASNLEAVADDPMTPPDEKFFALGLFIQVQTKLTMRKQHA